MRLAISPRRLNICSGKYMFVRFMVPDIHHHAEAVKPEVNYPAGRVLGG